MAASGARRTRFRAVVEYDGTAYFGFQRQVPEQPTIQSELEAALLRVAKEPVPLTGSGRTDSGVHARGQVVAFELSWLHGVSALRRALNANLPADIVVHEVDEAPNGFHPRFSAKCRAYEYLIYNQPVRSPLRRQRSWFVETPLVLARMQLAAAALVGVHDFATFGNPPQGDNSVREVFRATWEARAEYLVFIIEANAFLYRMVRALVGSMRAVGDGSWSTEEFVAALDARERSRAAALAPPQGLYLVSVTY